ncbi:MAG TPA: hypothetical protein VJW51_12165 [Candidatus Acidoferrales bacterium]|nr:hypothetical protein [Candidatus Acidoferrales bacterium]
MPWASFAQQAGSPAQQAPPAGGGQAPAQPAAPPPGAQAPPAAPNPQSGSTLPAAPKPTVHRFWDETNDWLFAGVLGARYLDFASTLNARRRGLDEVLLNNQIVDNHGEFAAIEFAGAATSVGVSYLFHRAGHHRLERWTSIVHIGVTVFGAVRNYALKTPHPAPI